LSGIGHQKNSAKIMKSKKVNHMKRTRKIAEIIAICVIGTSTYLTADVFCNCNPDDHSPNPANPPQCAQCSNGSQIFCNVPGNGSGCKSVSPAGMYEVGCYNLTYVGGACVSPASKPTYTETYACLQGGNPLCADQ
jgi:hypothetical protein